MNKDRLLAKSIPREFGPDRPPPESVYLPVHLADVHAAAGHVLQSTGDDQLRALGLSPRTWGDRFRAIVRLAAALHDLGKANSHFQEMVRGVRRLQGLRHEWITLLMVRAGEWREWLTPALVDAGDDWPIVLWCIGGHHAAYGRSSPPDRGVEGAGAQMTLYLGHPDFARCLDWLRAVFKLQAPPAGSDKALRLDEAGDTFSALMRLVQEGKRRWDRFSEETRGLVAAAKVCLIGADIAGSALPKTGLAPERREHWVKWAFANVPQPDQIRQLVAERLGANELRGFQKETAESTARVTFVRAGCGTGKTVAAYQWAADRCPGKRLYFCYPTTGTATEGYRDYLFDPADHAGKFGAKLFHGRAEVDLELILGGDGGG